ncbi:MAG: S8 family serine peptidase [Candidatus Doudnabacteria bacterium]|nr:S8 family serine peptidase [Candidatus Doudnabacteria bacterium]
MLIADIAKDYDLVDPSLVFSAHGSLPQTYRSTLDLNFLARLKSDARIVYAQPDGTVKAAAIIRNDPLFTMDELQDTRQWYLPKIKIPQAWEFGQGSSGTTVAVVDTGIHASHVELNDGRIVEGYDTIANQTIRADSNSDDNGHGTAVAGIIGAISDNSKGIAGINKNVRIMPLKALAADGTGEISAVAAAIVWAADHGANIINLSLGGPGFGADQTLNSAITYAFNKGILIVSAAGNDLANQGQNLDTSPVYPVCSDNGANMVLGVAATDSMDTKASFSNFGINCIDISAPGKKILTTAYLPSDPSDNILIYGSGTSLATPIVSGVAALIKSNHPQYTNVDLRNILLSTADNIDNLNQTNCLNSSCNGFLGKGRINAFRATTPQPISEGSLIREQATGKIYLVTAGVKRLVSSFVFSQRGYNSASVINELNSQLSAIPTGDPLPPLEGTLIKAQSDPTVYIIHQGLKRALTFLVFTSRKYSFANVVSLPDAEAALFKLGDWYWPPDGTMVLITGNPTVYVMHRDVRRPVTYFVFTQRKLSFAKVVKVTGDEFSHIPSAGDSYWLAPVDGTLVKSSSDSTVYVIENETKRALSYAAFIARGYKFSNIKVLPQAEMDVIAPGTPIL